MCTLDGLKIQHIRVELSEQVQGWHYSGRGNSAQMEFAG